MTVALTLWLLPIVSLADQGNLFLWDTLVVQRPGESLDAARQRTLSDIAELLDALAASLSAVQSDKESQRLLISVAENLARLDLAEVHERLLYPPLRDGSKAILFDLRRESSSYTLMAYDPNALVLTGTRFLPPLADRLSAADRLRNSRSLGDRWALLSIGPPATHNGNYTMNLQTNLRIGHGEPEMWWRSFEGLIRSFEDLTRRCALAEVTRGKPQQTFSSTEACDRALLGSLHTAFPQIFTFVSQYLDIQHVGEWIQQHNAFQLDLAVQLRQERLNQDYPSFAHWLKRTAGLFNVRSRVHDTAAYLLADGSYDSAHYRLTAEAVFRAGRLLACHEGWRPLENHQGYSFTDYGTQFFHMHLSSHSKIAGIEVAIEDLATDVTTRLDNVGFLWEQRMRKAPTKVQVTGLFFGIIPQWLVEILLRRGLDTIPRDFLAAVSDGPNGKGTLVSMAARKNEENSFDLTMEIATKILNERLVRLGAEFGLRSYLPGEAEVADIKRFVLNFLQQARQDLTQQQRLWQEASIP